MRKSMKELLDANNAQFAKISANLDEIAANLAVLTAALKAPSQARDAETPDPIFQTMTTHEADGNSLSPSHVDSPEAAAIQEKAHKGSSSSGSKHESREHAKDRDRDRDKDRDKDRKRDREKDCDRHHRDRHRDRSDRRDRTRDREDDDYYRSQDSDRRRDYDRDREERRRHRSSSRSRDRSDHRSRSRSRSRTKSKRMSGFDMAPPAALLPNTGSVVPDQLPGTTPAIPGMFPNMLPLAGGQFGGLPVMPVQAVTQQAIRHARRVYVGGLPPTANEQSVATFFSHVMSAIGGNTAGPGDAVMNVYINHEKKFAFVEMRSVEEASNAMALDDIIFEGAPVKVRRPSDYNPSLAATLGPSQPNPNLNLAAVGLTPGSAGGLEGADRIFDGGFNVTSTKDVNCKHSTRARKWVFRGRPRKLRWNKEGFQSYSGLQP